MLIIHHCAITVASNPCFPFQILSRKFEESCKTKCRMDLRLLLLAVLAKTTVGDIRRVWRFHLWPEEVWSKDNGNIAGVHFGQLWILGKITQESHQVPGEKEEGRERREEGGREKGDEWEWGREWRGNKEERMMRKHGKISWRVDTCREGFTHFKLFRLGLGSFSFTIHSACSLSL